MRLLMLGINHRTAGVELREKMALSGTKLERALDDMRRRWPQSEAVIVSTCNRTEIYLARASHEKPDGPEVMRFLSDFCPIDHQALANITILRENEPALVHLFSVASGLESMILGEAQILGQIKRAYETAIQRQTVGPTLHKVFQQALATAKRVRTETTIDQGCLSIGSAAVEFANRLFDRFDDKSVLGIGAGEMAKLTMQHLMALNPAKIWLTNRSPQKAVELAQQLALADEDHAAASAKCQARPMDDLDELLAEADIVLTSTSSPQPILTSQRLSPILRRRMFRPLFILDIAVPRDVEASVGSLPNVYLYDIDDLQQSIGQTQQQRQDDARIALPVIRQAATECLKQVQNQHVGQIIKSLKHKLSDLAEQEYQRTLRRIATQSQTAANNPAVQAMLQEHNQRLINKILHIPMAQLDSRNPNASPAFYAAAMRRLFDLPPPPPPLPLNSPLNSPDHASDITESLDDAPAAPSLKHGASLDP